MANMADFVTVVKFSATDRLRNSISTFANHLVNGTSELIMAPFSAALCLLETHRTYVNQVKLSKEAAKAANKQTADEIKELFDTREPWKKEHDKEYGEE